jgi:predicted patatin/cPLA2 family phospholipase|tara:strand:- start:102 stop:302 length:201 start_codon:yes stop_codon:yes gene_type:complete
MQRKLLQSFKPITNIQRRMYKKNKKYHETQKEINDIKNKIKFDQIKVKIKAKMQKKRNVNLIRTID